jgi:hypothetical protein
MPANLDYELYFNIAFFAVIGIGFLIGMIRGLKKSLYALVVTALFYGLFFVTIDAVVNQLWVLPLPFLFTQLGGVDPALVNAQTLGDAFSILLESYLGDMVGDMLTNEEFLAFVTGVALFAVKLVYTILYFTVFQLIYRFIFFIIRLMFFGRTQAEEDYKLAKHQIKKMKLKGRELRRMKKGVKKDFKQMSRKERRMQIKQDKKLNKKRTRNKEFKRIKKETKLALKQMSRKERRRQSKEEKLRQRFILKNGYYFNERQLTQFMQKPSKLPLMGAVAGAAKGTLSAFVTLIILGGMLNIMESFISIIPEDQPTVSREYIEHVYLANGPVDTAPELQPMASPFAIPPELESQLDLANDVLEAFNNNIFVSNASSITYGDENYNEEIPLHLYLFDSVLSFNYRDEKIMFRQELDTFSDTAGVLLNSEFVETNDLSDITSDEIIELFDTLSNSRLITSLLPLGIEVGSEVLEVDVAVPTEELYAIDWQAELQALGSVAAVGFQIVNQAGLLVEDPDLTTITLDGEEVEGLFDSLADSELVTLAAYVAIEPLLEGAGEQLQAIITVPADLDWANEFRAFGEVANAVLSTGITMDQLSDGDPTVIIGALSTLDFTILLNSDIVTQAMINIFSGAAGLEGLDMIIVPDGIEWLDLEDGGDVIRGELYNILSAVNAITSVFEDFSFENIDITFLSNLENDTIDTIFESDVLVATISNFVTEELDLGDTPLIIPDSVFDLNGYITNVEMKAVVNSVKTLIDNLPCEEGDTACQDIGFDFEGALTLETSAITTVVQSDIIGATVGNLIVDQAGTILTIPTSAMMSVNVDEIPTDIITKQEIIDMFDAIAVLEFDDLETMEFDATIINNLAMPDDTTELDPDKTAQLFGSKIVHATISHMLIDLEETDGILVVPKFAADNSTEIREYDATDELDYVSKAELDDILQALLKLDISDFNAIDSLDLNDIIDNQEDILASSILQATVTKQVLDLGSDVVTVPFADQDGNSVRVTVGDALAGTDTEYIVTDEISAILDALVVLDATDIQNFSGDVDVQSIASDSTKVDTLLSSATIHATLTTQLLNLEDTGVLAVPYLNETGNVNIRVSTGPVGNQTEFIIKSEIQAMLDVLNLLGITDNLDQFNGNVNIGSVLADPTGVDTLLSSATIHATISKQLFDLEEGGTLAVPYFNESETAVRVTVGDAVAGTDTEYMIEAEVRAMLDVLDLLGIADDLENFDGAIDMGTILGDPTNYDTLLASATIHATISKQLFDLGEGGTLAVPYFNESGTAVRITVGDVLEETNTDYVTNTEVRAMLDVLDLLGIADDLANFDGAIDMGTILADPANYDTLLASATIHATISKQLFDLGEGGTLAVPYFNEDGDAVRITVGNVVEETDTDYMTEVEVRAMLDVLDLLGIADDLANFDGAIDMGTILADPANYDTLLASATIHATISKQLFDLGEGGTLAVPYFDEDDNAVRVTVGDPLEETNTDYMTEVEVRAMLDVLDLLGIADDLENFNGSVNLGAVLGDPTGVDTLMLSATIHATISKQLFDLGEGGTLAVPYFDEDDNAVRITVGDPLEETNTDYMTEVEVRAMLDVLDLLGIADDLENFDGAIDMGTILADPANYDILLASSTIQATMSKQLFDLNDGGTLVVPYLDEDSDPVRATVGNVVEETDTQYILEAELRFLLDALNALGLADNLDTFDGQVDIAAAAANKAEILASATIQATISKQMIDLDTGDSIVLPFFDEDDVAVRVTVSTGNPGEDTEYVTYEELDALISAMDTLGITDDIANFSPSTVDLSILGDPADPTPAQTVFASAMIQATVSDQLLNLTTSDTFVIPYLKYDDTTDIRITRGVVLDNTDNEFILSDELIELVQVLDLLGITDVETFTGNINLDTFFDPTNRAQILESSIMQATISAQMLELGAATLPVPYKDIDDNVVRKTVADGDLVKELEYISVDEIDAMFGAFKELGITDFDNFTGVIDISVLDSTAKQNAVLASASIHAKISELLTTLDSAVLIVPVYSQAGETPGNEIRTTITDPSGNTEFIVKAEIRALMDSFTLMGYDDLNSFPAELDSSVFFDNRATLLLSSSIQATISDKMINGTGGELVVPDQDIRPVTAIDIRLEHGDGTVYIQIDELNYIFDGLDSLGLTDFATMSFNPGALFSQDLNTLFQSASLQATISKNILNNAIDETGPEGDINTYSSGTLVVPSALRAAITVDGAGTEHIDKNELIQLLEAMDALGFNTSFGDGVGGSAITAMDDPTLDEMFDSGTIHTTIHFMLEKNSGLVKPDQAKTNLSFLNNINTEAEIRYLFTALGIMGNGDFSSGGLGTPASIFGAVGSASDRSDMADSMIVRATLHDQVETIGVPPFYNTAITAADYMDNDTNTFFIKATFLDIVNTIYPPTS